jgi:hypothetical protein
MLFLGGIFYIGLLLVNAVAVLSEDRFLARSACPLVMATFRLLFAQSDGHPFNHQILPVFNKIMTTAVDTGILILCKTLA